MMVLDNVGMCSDLHMLTLLQGCKVKNVAVPRGILNLVAVVEVTTLYAVHTCHLHLLLYTCS